VRQLAVVTALSGVATLLTPLGPRVITLVLGMTNEVDIVEWRPAWETMPAGAILAVVAIALVAAWRARPPVAWEDRVLAAGSVALLPLAVRYSRVIPMFIVIALPLIARAWESRRPHAAPKDDSSVLHSAAVVATAFAAAIWIVVSWAGPDPALAWEPLPEEATHALRSCGGPVYNRFDDGGYLIWFAPDIPVFIDSRVDPYPKQFLRDQIDNERTGDYETTFAEWKIDCALLPPRSSTAQRLQQDGWRVTYVDSGWLVLEHP
jgi:hypothetical protein